MRGRTPHRFTDRNSHHVWTDPDSYNVYATCMQGCTISLLGQMSALRLRGLRRCRIVAGPVDGATYLEGTDACFVRCAPCKLHVSAARCAVKRHFPNRYSQATMYRYNTMYQERLTSHSPPSVTADVHDSELRIHDSC